MNTYKTKDGIDRILPGIGRTVNGLIATNQVIENSMFELVPEAAPAAPVAAAPVSQPQSAPQPIANKETM